ncbi:MAG: hypothetical protein HY791_35030 [Deltaproteobacteria bacterium]|nr:hypothetical protein [Deltaproteobacteria bacterium]
MDELWVRAVEARLQGDADALAEIALDPSCGPEILARIATDELTRLAALLNPRAPADLLLTAVRSSEPLLRVMAATHPNVTPEALEVLLKSGSDSDPVAVLLSPGVTKELLDRLGRLGRGPPRLRRIVALAQALEGSPDWSQQAEALRAFGFAWKAVATACSHTLVELPGLPVEVLAHMVRSNKRLIHRAVRSQELIRNPRQFLELIDIGALEGDGEALLAIERLPFEVVERVTRRALRRTEVMPGRCEVFGLRLSTVWRAATHPAWSEASTDRLVRHSVEDPYFFAALMTNERLSKEARGESGRLLGAARLGARWDRFRPSESTSWSLSDTFRKLQVGTLVAWALRPDLSAEELTLLRGAKSSQVRSALISSGWESDEELVEALEHDLSFPHGLDRRLAFSDRSFELIVTGRFAAGTFALERNRNLTSAQLGRLVELATDDGVDEAHASAWGHFARRALVEHPRVDLAMLRRLAEHDDAKELALTQSRIPLELRRRWASECEDPEVAELTMPESDGSRIDEWLKRMSPIFSERGLPSNLLRPLIKLLRNPALTPRQLEKIGKLGGLHRKLTDHEFVGQELAPSLAWHPNGQRISAKILELGIEFGRDALIATSVRSPHADEHTLRRAAQIALAPIRGEGRGRAWLRHHVLTHPKAPIEAVERALLDRRLQALAVRNPRVPSARLHELLERSVRARPEAERAFFWWALGPQRGEVARLVGNPSPPSLDELRAKLWDVVLPGDELPSIGDEAFRARVAALERGGAREAMRAQELTRRARGGAAFRAKDLALAMASVPKADPEFYAKLVHRLTERRRWTEVTRRVGRSATDPDLLRRLVVALPERELRSTGMDRNSAAPEVERWRGRTNAPRADNKALIELLRGTLSSSRPVYFATSRARELLGEFAWLDGGMSRLMLAIELCGGERTVASEPREQSKFVRIGGWRYVAWLVGSGHGRSGEAVFAAIGAARWVASGH